MSLLRSITDELRSRPVLPDAEQQLQSPASASRRILRLR
jgi:hypothetical protein